MADVTHDDIIRRLDDMARRMGEREAMGREYYETATRSIDRLQKAVGVVSEIVESCEDRVKNMESRVMAYDRLKDRVIGAIMGGGLLIAAVWWLIKDKLASLFRMG